MIKYPLKGESLLNGLKTSERGCHSKPEGWCRHSEWVRCGHHSACSGYHSIERQVPSLMIMDIYGNVLRLKTGEFYANRDRASLNLYDRGAITLFSAKCRVCKNNGWTPSEIDDGDFLEFIQGLGYGRNDNYGK